MNTEEINRAIAEECGWTEGFIDGITPCWFSPDPCHVSHAPPNYHASLDACAEFENPMNHTQLSDCVAILIRDLGVEESITATAPQRCEAFLRMHNKWK